MSTLLRLVSASRKASSFSPWRRRTPWAPGPEPRRGLGWLLGPPPEIGSKEWYYKWNRIGGAVALVLTLYGIHNGNWQGRLFDEEGNFSPRIRAVPQAQLEVEREQARLAEEMKALKQELGIDDDEKK